MTSAGFEQAFRLRPWDPSPTERRWCIKKWRAGQPPPLDGSSRMLRSGQYLPNSFYEPNLVFRGEFVLPDAHDVPAPPSKRTTEDSIASYVSVNLGKPVALIALWHPAMSRAPVPETSIHKKSNLPLLEAKIRVPNQVYVSPPS